MSSVKYFLKKNRIDVIIFLIFLLLSIEVTAVIFSGWKYVHQIDGWFTLDPAKQLDDVLYYWKDDVGFGYSSPDFHSIQFNSWQTGLLTFLNYFIDYWRSLVLSQFLIYFATFFAGMLSAFLFFGEFLRAFVADRVNFDKNKNKAILLVISVFYVFNQYTLIYVFCRYTAWTILWIGLPLIAFFYLKFLRTGAFKYMFGASLLTLLTPLSGILSLGVLPVLLATLFLLFLGTLIINPKRECLIRFSAFLVIFLLLNSVSLVPQILAVRNTATSAQISLGTDREGLEYSSRFTNILNIFRFLGYYGLYGRTYSDFPFAWVRSFANPVLQVLTFAYASVLSMSFLLLLSEKRRSTKKVFMLFFGSIVILVLFMKGINDPFPNIAYWLLSVNSVFFRHSYDRFVHLFAFLFFLAFAYFIYRMSLLTKKPRSFFMLSVLVAIVFMPLCFPLFTGEVVHPSDRIDLSNTSYWTLRNEAFSLFPETQNRRVLVMPFAVDSQEYSYNISGTIHHPNDKSLLYYILPDAEIIQFPRSSRENDFLYTLYHAMTASRYQDFVDIIRKVGVDFIAYQRDSSDVLILGAEDIDIIKLSLNFTESLEKKGFTEKVLENENIVIYRLNLPSEALFALSSPALATDNPYLLSKVGNHSLITLDDLGALHLPIDGDVLILDSGESIFAPGFLYNLSHVNLDTFGDPAGTGWQYGKVSTSNGYFSAFYSNEARICDTDKTSFLLMPPIVSWDFGNQNSWTLMKGGPWEMSLERDQFSGNVSLRVTTDTCNYSAWSWIEGEEMNVSPGQVFYITTRMKNENTVQSHIVVYGYDESSKSWRQLRQIPPGQDGTADWKEYQAIVAIPSNITQIRPVLNAGWVNSVSGGNATTWFDVIRIYNITQYARPVMFRSAFDVEKSDDYRLIVRYLESSEGNVLRLHVDSNQTDIHSRNKLRRFVWKDLGNFFFETGPHEIVLENIDGFNAVSSIALLPETSYSNLRTEVSRIAENSSVIYRIEAESDLHLERANVSRDPSSNGAGTVLFESGGTAWGEIEIIKKGSYRFTLTGDGLFNVSIGEYTATMPLEDSRPFSSQTFFLPLGNQTLRVFPMSANCTLGDLWLYSVTSNETLENILGSPESNSSVLSYHRISPTLWSVTIYATKPVMLSFAESYDPQWMATVYASGERLEGLNPIPLYELINGFWINQTGELDIMIEYVPQRWFFYGSIISLTTLIASVTYLTYSYTKKRAPVTPSKNKISLESASQDVRAILSARSLDTC